MKSNNLHAALADPLRGIEANTKRLLRIAKEHGADDEVLMLMAQRMGSVLRQFEQAIDSALNNDTEHDLFKFEVEELVEIDSWMLDGYQDDSEDAKQTIDELEERELWKFDAS
jgi:hypothetical protein